MKFTKMLLLLFLAVVCISCGSKPSAEDIVLPPTRIGEEGSISASLEKAYTFSSAFSDADLVAHVKIGNWLDEDDEICITYYNAEIIEIFKGDQLDNLVLLQDGTSRRTLKRYPLFTNGNEVFLFLKKAVATGYENAYWILGSFTTILDVINSSDDMYLLDRYGIIGESMDHIDNYADISQQSDQIKAIAAQNDPIVSDMHYSYPYIFKIKDIQQYITHMN